MMDAPQLLETLARDPVQQSGIRQLLIERIDDMIQHDFQSLVVLLYRVDVNEKQLRSMLQENKDVYAAPIIADMLIKRQLEKKEWREKYKKDQKDIPDDERW
jgi:hypothetical protein